MKLTSAKLKQIIREEVQSLGTTATGRRRRTRRINESVTDSLDKVAEHLESAGNELHNLKYSGQGGAGVAQLTLRVRQLQSELEDVAMSARGESYGEWTPELEAEEEAEEKLPMPWNQ